MTDSLTTAHPHKSLADNENLVAPAEASMAGAMALLDGLSVPDHQLPDVARLNDYLRGCHTTIRESAHILQNQIHFDWQQRALDAEREQNRLQRVLTGSDHSSPDGPATITAKAANALGCLIAIRPIVTTAMTGIAVGDFQRAVDAIREIARRLDGQ